MNLQQLKSWCEMDKGLGLEGCLKEKKKKTKENSRKQKSFYCSQNREKQNYLNYNYILKKRYLFILSWFKVTQIQKINFYMGFYITIHLTYFSFRITRECCLVLWLHQCLEESVYYVKYSNIESIYLTRHNTGCLTLCCYTSKQ